jgi:hypothetical protein
MEEFGSRGTAEGPQWVSAADAADAAGITPGMVRNWARQGLIVSQTGAGPTGEQVLVRLSEVMRQAGHVDSDSPESAQLSESPHDPTLRLAQTADLAPIFQTIPDLVVKVTEMTDRAARAETKVEFLSQQVSTLRRRLREYESESEVDRVSDDVDVESAQQNARRMEEPVPEETLPAAHPLVDDELITIPEPSPEAAAGTKEAEVSSVKDEELPEGWYWPDELEQGQPRKGFWRRLFGRTRT